MSIVKAWARLASLGLALGVAAPTYAQPAESAQATVPHSTTAASEPAPATPPAPPAPSPPPPSTAEAPPLPAATTARRRWTPEEIARVRAELAEQRLRRARPRPRPYSPPRFTGGVELDVVARPDAGFERFDLGHVSPRYGVFVGYDLLQLQPSLTLLVELGAGLEHDTSDHLLGATTQGSLNSQTLQLGVGLRWEALRWLAPHLRVWGGASLFQLEVQGTTQAFDTEHATSAFGALGAGFLLHTAPRALEQDDGGLAALQLGLLVEAGYALRSAIDFSLHTKPDPRRLEVRDASLGGLDLSGPYLRLAAVIRL